MENKNANIANTKEHYTVDIFHIMRSLWRRAWVIVLVGILVAGMAFSYASFVVDETFSSSIMLYVNNTSSSKTNNNFNISASEISAAQELVKTYTEILNSRTTLEAVIEEANIPQYTYRGLASVIKAEPANETEIMRVTVTTRDPEESSDIANAIAVVLPERISEIIDGASVEIVESAVPNYSKVAPNITRYTIIGFFIGVVIAAAVLVITAMMDDTIHDEEYVIQIYECPILAKVPDLLDSGNKRRRYGYYYQAKNKPQTDSEESQVTK